MDSTAPCIRAVDFSAPARPVVQAAELVARAALGHLRAGSVVSIDFSAVRGISSAYFNVIFLELVREIGAAGLDARVRLLFDSNAMRTLADRSRQAVLAAAA